MVQVSQFNAVQGLFFTIPIFCIATMFAMGLDITVEDAVAPLRNLLALAVIVLVNNVFVPLVALVVIALPTLLAGGPFSGFAQLIAPLEGGQTIGFLLLVLASGSILGPTFAKISGATDAFAKGMMIALVVASALLLPIELKLLNSFEIGVATGFESGTIFTLLLLFQLLPLALGIVINVRYAAVAVRLRPLIVQLTGLSFLILLALFLMSSNATQQVTQPQQVAQPLEIVSKVLAGLEDLPMIGGIIKILEQLITIVWPYAVLAAVAAIIMIIGYYGGVAVRNIVGASGSGIPHSMASSTVVRNVSFALILAAEYASSSPDDGVQAIGMVLIFYLVSLIIAAHKAVQWGAEEETGDVGLEDMVAELTEDIDALGVGGGS